ncbi:MAG: hypothetical protein WBE01_01820, partial [Methyloceanibacter sp.]
MNTPISAKDMAPPKVTTGPLAGSRKIYSSPKGHPDVRVPFREIELTPASSSEAVGQKNMTPASSSGAVGEHNSFRVYDTSGPYSDEGANIDVNRGLPP